MLEVISVEILNFGYDDDGEKRLVGLRQASGRRQKQTFNEILPRHDRFSNQPAICLSQ